MADAGLIPPALRKLLSYGDLSFRDYVEVCLYHPEIGYYAGATSPIGRDGDYITAPVLSEVFAFALSKLVREFLSRSDDGVSTIVDVGCGDGSLIYLIASSIAEGAGMRPGSGKVRFFGVDRSLARVNASFGERVTFVRTLDELPRDGTHLVISNEMFDAFPFARLVMRGEHLHELWVSEREGVLDWVEHEAPAGYDDYFGERNIRLEDGQFADISLEWERTYEDLCQLVERGAIVTFDYGYPESRLFQSRARRYGTAAAYSRHRVSRDLLASPGEQDITAHINFTDLIRSGERHRFRTLYFDRQAKLLLALGITDHELFAPAEDLRTESAAEAVELLVRRESARQLVLPDSIGHDIRVLIQVRELKNAPWSFELPLF